MLHCFKTMAGVLAATLLLSAIPAAAGNLEVRPGPCDAGSVQGDRQQIVLRYEVRNRTDKVITFLKSLDVQIQGKPYNGPVQSYDRKVDVNFRFDPPLRPGDSHRLTTKFTRRVNGRDMPVYDRVRFSARRAYFNFDARHGAPRHDDWSEPRRDSW